MQSVEGKETGRAGASAWHEIYANKQRSVERRVKSGGVKSQEERDGGERTANYKR